MTTKSPTTQIERTRAHYRENFNYMKSMFERCSENPTKKIRGYTLATITPVHNKWQAMIAALDNNDSVAFKKAQDIVIK